MDGFLEHPAEAFADYRGDGRDTGGLRGEAHGLPRGRPGLPRRMRWPTNGSERRMARAEPSTPAPAGPSSTPPLTESLLDAVRGAVTSAGLWDELDTDWLLLDAELLPWSAKANRPAPRPVRRSRRRRARRRSRRRSARSTRRPAAGCDVARPAGADRRAGRPTRDASRGAYRRYCWPTDGLDGVRLAPFQSSPSEATTWADQDHGWHLALADRLVRGRPGPARIRPAACSSTYRRRRRSTAGDRVVAGAHRRRR